MGWKTHTLILGTLSLLKGTTKLVTVTDTILFSRNPPFGGEEEVSVKNYFPADMQTAETALLFLQIIMRRLKRPERNKGKPGRAAVVVPNGTLFEDGVCARIKAELLTNFNLHTIVRLPRGVFAPYTGIPTNLLFFRPFPSDQGSMVL